jgi:hypothetical protein
MEEAGAQLWGLEGRTVAVVGMAHMDGIERAFYGGGGA